MFKLNPIYWKLSSLNGTLAIVFGSIALLFPGIAIIALAIYFAIAILLGGIALSISSVKLKNKSQNWPNNLLEGLIGIIIGIIILARPESAAAVFLVIIGLWTILIGFIFIWTYTKKILPKIANSFYLIIGVVSMIIGLLIIFNPFESTRIIIILIGIYAIAYGISSIVNSSKSLS